MPFIEKVLQVVLDFDLRAKILHDFLSCFVIKIEEFDHLTQNQLVEVSTVLDLLALDKHESTKKHFSLCCIVHYAQCEA